MHNFLQDYGSLLMVFAACTLLFISGLISNNRERARRARAGAGVHSIPENGGNLSKLPR